MKTAITKYLVLASICSLIIYSCNNTTPTGHINNYITGKIAFVDTNFIEGGKYTIALYNIEDPPYRTWPYATEILTMVSKNQATYKISWPYEKVFYIGVAWVSYTDTIHKPILLGTYGCDTAHECTKHKRVSFPSFGSSYDFLSWVDTSKRLCYY